jgi:hypothetical protein
MIKIKFIYKFDVIKKAGLRGHGKQIAGLPRAVITYQAIIQWQLDSTPILLVLGTDMAPRR